MVWRLYLQVTQVSGAVWIKGRVKHIHPDASVLWLPREARGPSVRGGQEPARLLPLPGSCDTGAQEQTCKCQLGEFICEASHSVWLSVPQRCRNFTYLNATWLIIANVIKLAQKKKKKKRSCYLIHTCKSKQVFPVPHLLGLDSREEAIPNAA